MDQRAPKLRRRGEQAAGGDAIAPEIAFLEGRHVDRKTLKRASRLAREWGTGAEIALTHCGWISQDSYYRALAAHAGIGFSSLYEPVWEDDERDIMATAQPGAEVLAVTAHDGAKRLVIAPRGAALKSLLALSHGSDAGTGLREKILITTPERLAARIMAEKGAELSEHARGWLLQSAPEYSAGGGLTGGQKAALATAAAVLVSGLALAATATLALLNVVLAVIFAAVGTSRAGAALAVLDDIRDGLTGGPARQGEKDLPVYTLLVPLFREAAVVPHLIAALKALDYPRAKLDIKLILEAEDGETRDALVRQRLPACFHIIIVPPSQPQTKPKALNFALSFARGELVAIYDAEDRPDPGQLRRAVAAFAAAKPNLACVQARLGIYNAGRNWLTRQFAIEYSALFDALLPALGALRLPIPLGGTSNHFRRDILEEAGAWDAHNVTEDADLGFRLARQGYRVATLNSQTLEEACETFPQWLGQRTRWLKGWIQTYFVHMRAPARTFRELGPAGFAALNILIGGMVLSALVHPLFVGFIGYKLVSGAMAETPGGLAGWWLAALNMWNLTIGYAAAMLLAWVGLGIAGRRELRPAIAWMPLYWMLISFAAYRALWDYLRRPFHWEKTEHGAPRLKLAAKRGTAPRRRRAAG